MVHGKKNQNKSHHPAPRVILTARMQKWFLVFLALNWVSTLFTPFINLVGTGYHVNKGFLVYIVLQSCLPILFGLLTIPIVWRHYTGLLRRLFMTGFIGLVGLITFGAASSLETAVRYRWFPSHAYRAEPTFLQSYGQDVIVMVVSLVVYVAVLGLWDHRLAKRAGS